MPESSAKEIKSSVLLKNKPPELETTTSMPPNAPDGVPPPKTRTPQFAEMMVPASKTCLTPTPSADAPVGDVNVGTGGVQDFEVFLVVEVAGFAVAVAVVVGGVVEVEFIQDHAAAEAFIGHAVAVVVVGGAVLNIAIVEDAVAVAVAHVGFASIANAILVAVVLVSVWVLGSCRCCRGHRRCRRHPRV